MLININIINITITV